MRRQPADLSIGMQHVFPIWSGTFPEPMRQLS
jgi:hypothetical protein